MLAQSSNRALRCLTTFTLVSESPVTVPAAVLVVALRVQSSLGLLSLPQVFLDGQLSGYFDRNQGPETLPLTAPLNTSAPESGVNGTVLDILVSAMGRLNFGCGWDEKGLSGGNVTLDGAKLRVHGRVGLNTTTGIDVCALT